MAGEGAVERTDAGALRKRYFWAVISIMFAAFMSKLDIYIVNIAIPAIGHEFDATTSVASRAVLVYLLTGTSALLFFGRLGDAIGLKRLFILGFAVFTAGSLICGVSWSMGMLVFARFVQGIGGSMLAAAAYALIPCMLPREIIGWGFGLLATGASLGIVLGAPVGGFIVTYLNWHWVFILNVPVGVAAIALAARAIPKTAGNPPAGRWFHAFDIPGTVLSFAGFGLLVYGLNIGDERGWGSGAVISVFASSVTFLFAFVLWERRAKSPLVNRKVVMNARFMLASLSGFFAFMNQGGFSFLFPIFLQAGMGLTAFQTGLLTTIFSGIIIVLAPVAGRISDRVEPSIQCSAAMLLCTGATLYFSLTMGSSSLLPTVVFLVWSAIGFSQFTSPNNNQAMRLAPAGHEGSASGFYATLNALGVMFGVSIFETVFSQISPHTGSITKAGKHLAELAPAFRWAFVTGALAAFAAAILSMAILWRSGRLKAPAAGRGG